MTRPLLLVVALFAFLAQVPAETYPVRVTLRGSSQPAEASAVCVGKSQTQSLFLTNRHVAQGAVQLFVADGQRWVQATRIQLSQTADVASFTVQNTSFKVTPLMTGFPAGYRVDVCGYSSRSRFCFTGRFNGNNVDGGKTHVLPGDSGGAVLAKACDGTYCIGLANAYGTRNGLTYFVSAEQCRKHLTQYYQKPPRCQQYGNCPVPQQRPNYRRYKSVNPQLFGAPRIEFYEESTKPEIVEPPPTPVPDPISRAPLPPEPARGPTKKQIAAAVDTWMRENAGSLQIDADAVARIITKNYPERVRGPKGDPGIPPAQLADIKRRISSLEAGGAQPTRVDLPEGLGSRLEALEARAEQLVPIRVLNQDGSIYSKDEAHKWHEPIEIQLAPPQKGQTNGG